MRNTLVRILRMIRTYRKQAKLSGDYLLHVVRKIEASILEIGLRLFLFALVD